MSDSEDRVEIGVETDIETNEQNNEPLNADLTPRYNNNEIDMQIF